MKKLKIVAISSLLAILMCSCGGNSTSSGSNNKDDGFTYIPPEISQEDDTFVPNVDYKNNNDLYYLLNPDRTSDPKYKNLTLIQEFDFIDTNDAVINYGTYIKRVQDNYNYSHDDGLDIGNKNYKTTAMFERNLVSYLKSANIDIKKEEVVDVSGTPTRKLIQNIENATYSIRGDLQTLKIKEQYNFNDAVLDAKYPDKEMEFNQTNIDKALTIVDITPFKEEAIDFYNNDKTYAERNIKFREDEDTAYYTIKGEKIVEYDDNGVTRKNKYSSSYYVWIDKSGYVQHFGKGYTVEDVTTSSPIQLEYNEESWTLHIQIK